MLHLMTKLEIQVEGDASGRSHPLQMEEVTRAGEIRSTSEWNREAMYAPTHLQVALVLPMSLAIGPSMY